MCNGGGTGASACYEEARTTNRSPSAPRLPYNAAADHSASGAVGALAPPPHVSRKTVRPREDCTARRQLPHWVRMLLILQRNLGHSRTRTAVVVDGRGIARGRKPYRSAPPDISAVWIVHGTCGAVAGGTARADLSGEFLICKESLTHDFMASLLVVDGMGPLQRVQTQTQLHSIQTCSILGAMRSRRHSTSNVSSRVATLAAAETRVAIAPSAASLAWCSAMSATTRSLSARDLCSG